MRDCIPAFAVPHRTGVREIRGGSRAGHAAYDPAMLLAIDIGNTNVTIGLFKAGSLAASRRAATPTRATQRRRSIARVIRGIVR